MADEVRIHLSTYLRDAGIKATKAQVEKLKDDISKLNRQTQRETERTERALGRLPGVFGRIQSACSGAFSTGLAVIGAFKLGCDIGEWLTNKVILPLSGVGHPIEDLKKKNREIERSWKDATERFNESMEVWSAGWNKVVDGADKARQKIEDLTQAYLKMQAAQERGRAADDDAKLLGMQRDKFEAMAGAASPEEAASAGKYHDVLIAEERAKQRLAKFDRDAETSAVKQASAERELKEALNRRVSMMRQMKEMNEKLAYFQSQASVDRYGFEGSVEMEKELEKSKTALRARIDAADRDVERRRAEIAAMSTSRAAEAQERQNLVERAKLEVDERKKAYDDYVAYVEQEEAARAEEEWNRQQEEIRREAALELKERQRVERELAAQRIDDLRKELRERETAENEARSRQSVAEGSLSQAWGWYRDQSRMQAVIDEQKAQAAAEVQWQKDFERLKTWRRDWRTAEFGSLSASDEAVRQVAFAKEEKAAADRAVIETAENTRNLAEKMEELIAAK